MSKKFKTIITTAGAEKLAAATVPGGKKVNLTAMAVGDGGGTLPEPSAGQTTLINEVWRHALNKISQDNKKKNYIVAELVIPPDVGGFWMRELGLYDDAGALIAVANMAESYKPKLAEGSGRAQTCRMVIIVSNVDSVELSIDATTVMATQDYVDDKLAEHEKSRNHPDATLNEKGFVQLSSATDSVSESLAATPKAVKEAYDLANGKYTAQDASTAQKGIVQLSSATDSSDEGKAATPKAVKAAYDLANGKYTALDASTTQKGIVRLNSAIDSDDENLAATSKAVKIAIENANARLAKDRNGGDIPNKQLFIQNIGLQDTVNKADGAIQRSGDNMTGPLGLTRTSSFGVATENTLGGNSIAIGDNDSGFKSNGDGIIALMANSVLAGYFSENELQHRKKMLTKIFQAIAENNWTEGAGGFGSQLGSGAPFISPRITRPNDDNNYFPFWKQIVSLVSGYPVAASMGLMTTGKTNFPQIVIHAKTDFEVNDKLWVFDVATGEFRAPAKITAREIELSSNGGVAADGQLRGSAWGGTLSNYLDNRFNRKNTATLGFSGWSRDESTGLIMQWGNVDNARGTYSFPRAFNDTCFAVFATNKDGQGGAIDNAYGYPVSKTQFYLAGKANSGADTAYGISWFALGY
ncbi:phage tail protein [Escherichia coli]|uniref:phage tail-collar fiber domain-containing protein n=1 Tax=Escherichia coli TaxID=562 RepID=UPI001FD08672|nr:phage tail protein [Escherichia coli]MDC8941266.1 phage tail protein [Escherichia coli]UOQ31440.1 phage tail protein [Escherichia coli]HCQ0523700.1 phage tail protein [Escherichia coli]HCQ0608906.1 phage tail protein [Escherichia coli]HEP0107021.1 phage tail protein [Escherichia coli]